MMTRIKIITCLGFMVSSLSVAAQPESCKHRIVFLPQTLNPDQLIGAQNTAEENHQMAESQLKTADYIERFPQVPVFSAQAGLKKSIRQRINTFHPLLENNEALNKTLDPVKRWFKQHPERAVTYPPEIGALVYGAREKAALKQIKNFFIKNPTQRDVILIFGSNNSFSFYPEEFPPECVIIPREFQADWSGSFRSGPEGFPSYNYPGSTQSANALR